MTFVQKALPAIDEGRRCQAAGARRLVVRPGRLKAALLTESGDEPLSATGRCVVAVVKALLRRFNSADEAAGGRDAGSSNRSTGLSLAPHNHGTPRYVPALVGPMTARRVPH